jgi:SAM-dependent methyltransferase
MSWYVTAFGRHYGWLYAHRDEAEAEACVAALARVVPFAAGRVLDLGCGEGRHLGPLSAQGARGVVGVDLSPELLRTARARAGEGVSPILVRADMRALPVAAGAFATAVSLFTAFGYFGRLAEHRDLLAEVARVLAPGGHWCLDYLNCLRVRATASQSPPPTVRVAGPCRVTETRRLDGDGSRVLKRVQIEPLPDRLAEAAALGVPGAGLDYTEAVALFAPEELDDLAAGIGLVRVAALGGYDGRSFSAQDAERWILIYAKTP